MGPRRHVLVLGQRSLAGLIRIPNRPCHIVRKVKKRMRRAGQLRICSPSTASREGFRSTRRARRSQGFPPQDAARALPRRFQMANSHPPAPPKAAARETMSTSRVDCSPGSGPAARCGGGGPLARKRHRRSGRPQSRKRDAVAGYRQSFPPARRRSHHQSSPDARGLPWFSHSAECRSALYQALTRFRRRSLRRNLSGRTLRRLLREAVCGGSRDHVSRAPACKRGREGIYPSLLAHVSAR